ncbi:MAG: hypothetical protein A2173_06090 [Planctomycetes bacterium RBG_13_44_8b]|nr:MAG: hypothetical protein A2173_06090 [Planctomycetes bacterium RBG_13_44_8b]
MNSVEAYKDFSCENLNYTSALERRKRKSCVLAVTLGLLFGPFGTLYFGWAVFFTTFITYIFLIFLVALVSPFFIPPQWFNFILNLFFGFSGFMLASSYNEFIEKGQNISLAGLNVFHMNRWLVRVILKTTGLYSMVMFFSEGQWLFAILTLLCVEVMIRITQFLMVIVMSFLIDR